MQSKRPARIAEKLTASEKFIPCKRCGKTPSYSKFHRPAKQAYCNLCRKKGYHALFWDILGPRTFPKENVTDAGRSRAGVSNIRPMGQMRPTKMSNPAGGMI